MSLYKNRYRIESARLNNWDYSSNGYYFITICTKNRIPYFGNIINGNMNLSKIGKLAYKYWKDIPDHFSFAQLNKFVIMPNHIHGIILIDNRRHAIHRVFTTSVEISPTDGGITGQNNPMLNQSISKIVRWYKGRCTFEINKKCERNKDMINNRDAINCRDAINRVSTVSLFKWQSRFYDHVIRDNQELYRIQKYIQNNPDKWIDDEFNKKPVELR